MKLFQKCHGCNKIKFFVRKRKFYQPKLHIVITSEKPLCSHCVKVYKTIK